MRVSEEEAHTTQGKLEALAIDLAHATQARDESRAKLESAKSVAADASEALAAARVKAAQAQAELDAARREQPVDHAITMALQPGRPEQKVLGTRQMLDRQRQRRA